MSINLLLVYIRMSFLGGIDNVNKCEESCGLLSSVVICGGNCADLRWQGDVHP